MVSKRPSNDSRKEGSLNLGQRRPSGEPLTGLFWTPAIQAVHRWAVLRGFKAWGRDEYGPFSVDP